jgi:hypothetical protein
MIKKASKQTQPYRFCRLSESTKKAMGQIDLTYDLRRGEREHRTGDFIGDMRK